MTLLRSATTAALATAMLATSVAPAMAQSGHGYNRGYDGYSRNRHYGGDRYHRRHRGGSDAGAIIGGIVVLGAIAALASAASNNSRDRRYGDNYRGRINSENEAADACSTAVEQRGTRNVRVSDIDSVRRTRNGYEVRGQLEGLSGYGDRGSDVFSCSVRYGQVDNVRIGEGYSYNGY